MARGEATVQIIRRKGMDDLYVAGLGGVSVAFYNTEDLSMWLMQRGVSVDDPVWEYIEQLEKEDR